MSRRLRIIYYGMVVASILGGWMASAFGYVAEETRGLWALGAVEIFLFLILLCVTWKKAVCEDWEAVCFCLGGILLLIRVLGYGILTDFQYGRLGKVFLIQAGILIPGYAVVKTLGLITQARRELNWQKEERQKEIHREEENEKLQGEQKEDLSERDETDGIGTESTENKPEGISPWRAVHTPLARQVFHRLNRKNKKSGILLYVGSTLSCGSMLLMIALHMSFRALQIGKERQAGELAGFLFYSIIFMGIISVLILALALKPYVRGRKKDYILMHTLGMPKRVLNLWILKEYAMLQGLGLVSGYILGSALYGSIQCFLKRWYPVYAGKLLPSSLSHLIALACVVILLVYSTFINYEIYTETELGTDGKGREKDRFRGGKRSPYEILAGMGILILACLGYQWQTVRESAYCLILATIGMITFLSGVASACLSKNKKDWKKYFGSLPASYSFYAHYKKYKRQAMALFALHFFFLSFLMIRGMSLMPLREIARQFPYDYVVLGKSQERLKDLRKEYRLTGEEIPIVRLTVPSVNELNGGSRMDISFQGQQIGIAEKTYRKLTGKSLGLSGKEIAIFFQREKGEVAHPLDFTVLYGSPRIRVGTPRNYLWYERDKEFDRSYQVAAQDRRRIIGPLSEGRQEQILVFSDTYFQKIYREGEFPSWMGMYRLAKETNLGELKKRLLDYQESYGEYSKYDDSIRAVYEKQALVEKTESFYLLKLFVYGFLGILFQVCIVYVMVWRYGTDIEEWKERMEKYQRLGMKKKDREQILKREFQLPCHLALAVSVCMTILFVILTAKVRYFSIREFVVLFRFMAMGTGIYAVVHWALIRCFAVVLKNRVGGE